MRKETIQAGLKLLKLEEVRVSAQGCLDPFTQGPRVLDAVHYWGLVGNKEYIL